MADVPCNVGRYIVDRRLTFCLPTKHEHGVGALGHHSLPHLDNRDQPGNGKLLKGDMFAIMGDVATVGIYS